MSTEIVFANAAIVLADRIVKGSVQVRDGAIAAVDEGTYAGPAIDCEGDYLLPGLVELHTDNMEKHFSPRPGVAWPAISAVLAHDAQIATAGITTVLDAVAVGDIMDRRERLAHLHDMIDAVEQAGRHGVLRAEHLLHLRCEVSFAHVVELFGELADKPSLRLVSIMDHTPGQRQFVDLAKYREYYQGKFGLSDAEMDAQMARQTEAHRSFSAKHRKAIVDTCRARGIALASHDDATVNHVAEAVADGMAIAEFPTTHQAAEACRAAGLRIMMGGPNVVRGASHSGNISARRLAEKGLLDIVSSDYVPASMLHAAFLLHQEVPGISLSAAIASVSQEPAQAIGLTDRGEIAPGKRADLVRARLIERLPVIAGVWRAGQRIA